MQIKVQKRSDKVDLFAYIIDNDAGKLSALIAEPVRFKQGKVSTDPERALMTLAVKEARDLANKILRTTGKEGD
jgi:hypothetical protein